MTKKINIPDKKDFGQFQEYLKVRMDRLKKTKEQFKNDKELDAYYRGQLSILMELCQFIDEIKDE